MFFFLTENLYIRISKKKKIKEDSQQDIWNQPTTRERSKKKYTQGRMSAKMETLDKTVMEDWAFTKNYVIFNSDC